MTNKAYPCLVCKQNCKKTEVSVPCQVCEQWTHPKCSAISEDLLKYLTDETDAGNDISWTCKHCSKVGKVLLLKIRALTDDVIEMKKDMSKVKDENIELVKQVKDLGDNVDKYRQTVSNMITTSKSSILSELREREERKQNVIFYGIPEARDDLQGYQKKKYDTDYVFDVASCLEINLRENDLKYVRRLGKKGNESRPLQAGFYDEWPKKSLLRYGKNLKESRSYNRVFISADLTQTQRKEEKDMEIEVVKRNSELEYQDALNSEWKVVGIKGERRMMLTQKYKPNWEGEGQYRGGWRGRGRGQGGMRGQVWGRGRACRAVIEKDAILTGGNREEIMMDREVRKRIRSYEEQTRRVRPSISEEAMEEGEVLEGAGEKEVVVLDQIRTERD